ncbi:putative tight adherance operon protein [Yersinia frederiksenii]|uniref:TadE/TadG family type IV pilus assembly protein n=1 Tax=Yersinia frederiksenii TaxID=29484 RepID=UPI0005E7584E|nr:TadE/TadG family type IV pilus assembly protein [Yersinia frederiksenii]CNC50329.1 putative tight adherance operon protein [Yersinia frederiksenii]
MRNLTIRLVNSNKGSITIEFSITFLIFIFTLLFSAEISRLFYISASLDLAFSEAVKSAKNKQRNENSRYNTVLKAKLLTQQGVLGSFITKTNSVKTSVKFSQDIHDIINNNMSNDDTLPLAKYTVRYSYQPIFFPIPSYWGKTLLSREVIFVQEN